MNEPDSFVYSSSDEHGNPHGETSGEAKPTCHRGYSQHESCLGVNCLFILVMSIDVLSGIKHIYPADFIIPVKVYR